MVGVPLRPLPGTYLLPVLFRSEIKILPFVAICCPSDVHLLIHPLRRRRDSTPPLPLLSMMSKKKTKALKASRGKKGTSPSPPKKEEGVDATKGTSEVVESNSSVSRETVKETSRETAQGGGGGRRMKEKLLPVAGDRGSSKAPAARAVYFDPTKELPPADGFAGEKQSCWAEVVRWTLSSAGSGGSDLDCLPLDHDHEEVIPEKPLGVSRIV